MNFINITTHEYPVSDDEFRKRFPSAPYPIPPSQLFRYGYAKVYEVPKPILGEFEQAVEMSPEKVGVIWRQVWAVVDYFTADEQVEKEIADRKAFSRKEAATLAVMKETQFRKNMAKALNIKP